MGTLVTTTDLVLAATVIQTVVLTFTLVIFIFQFRSQEKAIRESSYQSLMGRYNDFIMTQLANPLPNSLYVDQIRRTSDRQISPEEVSIRGHLLIIYGIIEEAYLLYKKKWIDEETWNQWAAWLKTMAKHPQFAPIHTQTQGMFDKDYQDYISKILNEK
jgi:hypothetical protein